MIRRIVVIGPSGNGKSALAGALARRLGWRFVEGDRHHPPANIAKMARGEPLSEADRAPFLDGVGGALAACDGCVAACSALRRAHREALARRAGEPLLFVLPLVAPAELRRRLETRSGHFMPPSLLASQLAAFEPPGADERCLEVDGMRPIAALAREIAEAIGGCDGR